MPVVFNEPLSFLQRISEYMEHTHLIHKACSLSDSIDRMQVGIKIFLLDSVFWASICRIDNSNTQISVGAFGLLMSERWKNYKMPFRDGIQTAVKECDI